ncbi:PfkB family carbohydrate kinase [Alphaproteobacteria bacterium]|nr:PfkB family carbohydrate kinase [Alphaproteobacteria bacterium]
MRNYLKKIITAEKISKKIGKFPRKILNRVSMCHGVFDLVHPGHIRHLQFAKTKSSTLIVSITADLHVDKAALRPYVPQQLRAENLAALEFVDYVIIDKNPTPLVNIKKIKPDFFVKGHEYVSGEINPKTQEEMNVIENYGGKFIYTPGDFVMSSSRILQEDTPDLSLEKLNSLMEGEKISFKDIKKSLNNLKNTNVFVLGDTIIDTYVRTSLIGNNAKTPTFSTRYIDEKQYIGGAAIIANHLKSAGAKVTFCSILGNDKNGKFVKKNLKKNKIIDETLTLLDRPTTEKKYFISENHRLLKVDTVDNSPVDKKIIKQIVSKIKNFKNGIIIFSDFRHGVFHKNSIFDYINSINKNIFKVADSQVASRWGNILDFKHFDLITPNEKEIRFSLADQDTAIRPLASQLYKEAKCKYLILKLGPRGILTFRRELKQNDIRSFFVIDALEKNAIDPVGCGDALLSYASLSLFESKNIVISSILGSISASIESTIDGNEPVKLKDVLAKLDKIEKSIKFV